MSAREDTLTVPDTVYARCTRAELRAARLSVLVRELEADLRTLAALDGAPEAVRDFATAALGRVREAERAGII